MGKKHSPSRKLHLKDKYDSVLEKERERAAEYESVLMKRDEWQPFCKISHTLSNSSSSYHEMIDCRDIFTSF